MPEWPYILEATDIPGVPQNQYIEPISITAGDQVLFYRTLPLYPSNAGWSLKYSLRGVAGFAIDFVGTQYGTSSDHQMLVLPATTAPWAPGQYTAQGYATNTTSGPGGTPERHVIYNGLIRILPNLAIAAPETDQRTHGKRMLDMIEATLEGRAGDDILNSSIEGTMIQRIPVPDLLRLRSYYHAMVKAEEAKAKIKGGRATGRSVFIRFANPS